MWFIHCINSSSYSVLSLPTIMRGSRGRVGEGPNVHFHSYASNRINPQNNNQITSIQVCVMGFFLLRLEPPPPLEKFSGSAPALSWSKKTSVRTLAEALRYPCRTRKILIHITNVLFEYFWYMILLFQKSI